MRLLLLLPLCLIASAPAALAQVDCSKPMAQQDLNACAAENFARADDDLNAVWKQALARAKKFDGAEREARLRGAKKALLAGQRGWLAYRDGQCDIAGFQMRGGSAEPMLVSGCKATMTRTRTAELKEFAGIED